MSDEWAWQDEANCKGRLDLFFPTSGERPSARIFRELRAGQVCGACPVLTECRTAARANREPGYWGGESERERHALGCGPLNGFALLHPIVDPGACRASGPPSNYGYSAGCRCDGCRAAAKLVRRAQRARAQEIA